MAMLVLDHWVEERVRNDRKSRGIDGHDEVWGGIYVIFPPLDNEQQELRAAFVDLLYRVVRQLDLGKVRPGVNISDRDDDWTLNYRCPDVVVFLNGTTAINRGTYWFGGPDFAVEILSEEDRSRDKLGFYASVNVRELLLV